MTFANFGNQSLLSVNNISVRKYWKILFYPPNTDTGTFYRGSTDFDTDAQYPKFNTDILVFPLFYTTSILCFKALIDYYTWMSISVSWLMLKVSLIALKALWKKIVQFINGKSLASWATLKQICLKNALFLTFYASSIFLSQGLLELVNAVERLHECCQ